MLNARDIRYTAEMTPPGAACTIEAIGKHNTLTVEQSIGEWNLPENTPLRAQLTIDDNVIATSGNGYVVWRQGDGSPQATRYPDGAYGLAFTFSPISLPSTRVGIRYIGYLFGRWIPIRMDTVTPPC